MQPSEYLTAKAAADECNVSIRTMQRWIAQGRVHAEKEAVNRWRIRRASLPGHKPSLAERMSELERRVEALEGRHTGVITRTHLLAPSDLPLTRAQEAQGWPASLRGQARIIAERTGAQWATVREWARIGQWRTYGDAKQWVLTHKGIVVS